MADIYSVIRQSILDRNLRSASARKEVYTQARTAMIRQLWTYDPPLSEPQIDERIREFDGAVKDIEREVVEAFAEPAPPPPKLPARRKAPEPPAPVYEGYDEDADYAAAIAAPAEPPREERPVPRRPRDPRPALPAPLATSLADIEAALAHRSAAIESALRGAKPGPAAEEEEVPDYRFEEARDVTEEGHTGFAEEEDRESAWPYGDEAANDRQDSYEDRHDEPVEYEPVERGPAKTKREKAPRAPRKGWRDLSERTRITVLLSAIGGLAVVLVGLAVFLLLPASDTPIAAGGTPAAPVSPQATAPGAVVESFTIFDGRDPTIFESGPGNPIRFSGDASGGFARVSSSAADSGVRVTIGPGLADRLAGRTIRLTLVARSARENGAVGLRFAYQSGVALSHWQTANLSPDYVALALTWRVPTQRTDPTGDHILIEPGIPGDGTGADIRTIRLDLLG